MRGARPERAPAELSGADSGPVLLMAHHVRSQGVGSAPLGTDVCLQEANHPSQPLQGQPSAWHKHVSPHKGGFRSSGAFCKPGSGVQNGPHGPKIAVRHTPTPELIVKDLAKLYQSITYVPFLAPDNWLCRIFQSLAVGSHRI